LLFPQADHIIAVSNGVAESLTEASGIAPAKIDVIYNPVITPELAEKRCAPLQHPWFAGETRVPVLLAVGRLMAQKQFGDLIEAFARVRADRQAKLIILGEGEERPRLEQKIQSLNLTEDVSLTGFVDNPYAYMANADLFVLSSIFEGLPTVMVEALYCDLPIVATDCPSGPHEILDGGRYGRLTPVGNPTKLAENILAALDGDIPQPTPESWQPYTMDFVIDQYLALLLPQTVRPAETVFGVSAL
jgi:glycosyltransferase involved in cell wall biosynthesis